MEIMQRNKAMFHVKHFLLFSRDYQVTAGTNRYIIIGYDFYDCELKVS